MFSPIVELPVISKALVAKLARYYSKRRTVIITMTDGTSYEGLVEPGKALCTVVRAQNQGGTTYVRTECVADVTLAPLPKKG